MDAGPGERFADDVLWQGKQYIVIAVKGGSYPGEYIAYALPDSCKERGPRQARRDLWYIYVE